MYRIAAAAAVIVCLVAPSGFAFSPPPPSGPALETDAATLDRAVRCPVAFSGSHEPVLLVHGTAGRPEDHWGWSYLRILPEMGFDVCTVRLPEFALVDIQESAEYVVHAVRVIAAAAGNKVDVVGYSQGGLEPRWAVRWWPDVRESVDDLVMMATPNHGAGSADGACAGGSCQPAIWQMSYDSAFLAALNAGDETPGEIDYTSVFSLNDELVQPAAPEATAALDGASNVLVQDVCPGRPVHHGDQPADAVVFALVHDALTHAGGADPARLDPAVCTSAFLPGMTPDDALAGQVILYGNGAETVGFEGTRVPEEPPLRPYAAD